MSKGKKTKVARSEAEQKLQSGRRGYRDKLSRLPEEDREFLEVRFLGLEEPTSDDGKYALGRFLSADPVVSNSSIDARSGLQRGGENSKRRRCPQALKVITHVVAMFLEMDKTPSRDAVWNQLCEYESAAPLSLPISADRTLCAYVDGDRLLVDEVEYDDGDEIDRSVIEGPKKGSLGRYITDALEDLKRKPS